MLEGDLKMSLGFVFVLICGGSYLSMLLISTFASCFQLSLMFLISQKCFHKHRTGRGRAYCKFGKKASYAREGDLAVAPVSNQSTCLLFLLIMGDNWKGHLLIMGDNWKGHLLKKSWLLQRSWRETAEEELEKAPKETPGASKELERASEEPQILA
eukprot:TRINITY_DN8040_c1_g2_i3.p1 TRINITY_DN8040_c1_g2~~TRINITY_DN8040_c1_g2_i3.p1  ORF type:complete len:156 (-),score=27.01 TRINITY_DN8040_c1_g2_i3:126-593(-)